MCTVLKLLYEMLEFNNLEKIITLYASIVILALISFEFSILAYQPPIYFYYMI